MYKHLTNIGVHIIMGIIIIPLWILKLSAFMLPFSFLIPFVLLIFMFVISAA